MTRDFFEAPALQARLIVEAQSWIDTPFHPHAAVKGAGVDCVWLAAKLYITCGVIKEFNPPAYTMDGGAHNQLSQILDWLASSPAFCRSTAKIKTGDLLTFTMGRAAHHVGVAVEEGHFIHVYRGQGVLRSSWNDTTWARRLAAIFRPVAESPASQPAIHTRE